MEKYILASAGKVLAELLMAVRHERGLTQIELAQRVGKPQPFVSRIELGERRVDIVEFCQLSTALDTPPETLFARFIEKLSHTAK